jgi:hypothetical protein
VRLCRAKLLRYRLIQKGAFDYFSCLYLMAYSDLRKEWACTTSKVCWSRIRRECDSISSPYSDTFPPATINRQVKGKSYEKVCWFRIRECDSISSPYSDTFPPATINRLVKGKSQEKACWPRIGGECDSISSPYSDTFPPATINRLLK